MAARHLYDPREVMTGAATAPRHRVAIALVEAALVALLFGSPALLAWAEALPVGPLGDAALGIAAPWHDAMHTIGLDRPYDAIRAAFRELQGWRW